MTTPYAFTSRHIDKPWGYELIWAESETYVGKVLFVRAGQALSLQYHEQKDESWLVQSGRASLELGQVGGELETLEIVAGRLLPLPARHRASRHGARGHDDPRGLDAAPRRRRPARRPLRPARARRVTAGEASLLDYTRSRSPPKARPEHGYDSTTRCERPRPRRRGRPQDRMGRPADAGAPGHSRALRAREAARRLPRLRLPARHDRDREPDAHPQGRRRRRRPVRVEPAVHAG